MSRSLTLLQFYDDICEMLVTAGYFRARISTLPPFDKILGGLTWYIIFAVAASLIWRAHRACRCITAGASAIDIDLFFDEVLLISAPSCGFSTDFSAGNDSRQQNQTGRERGNCTRSNALPFAPADASDSRS